MSNPHSRIDDESKREKGDFTNISVNVVSNWVKKKKINNSSVTKLDLKVITENNEEKPRKLKSFNSYLTNEEEIQSANDVINEIPSIIEGTYKHDFNIVDIHKLIINKFNRQKEHDIKRLEQQLRDEEIKINRRQNMVERKASLKVIENIRKNIEDILTDKSFNEYLRRITPLIDNYNILGSISKIVSFAKNKRSDEDFSDEAPEDEKMQEKRHQLILDFVEIARKYIQIDLIREVREGNNCPACGTKLDESMSSMDDDGISICSNCGIERISVVRARFYQDNARTNNSGNNYEDRANFKKVLMRYQGKQPDKPPSELYEKLEEYFISNQTPKIDTDSGRKFISPEDIRNMPVNSDGEKMGTSRSLMYKALKDTGNSDYYDHINIILNEVWGWSLPDVSHLEDQIIEDYDTSQRIYEMLPKDRKSSLNSQYRLYKHLRRLGHYCKTKDFRIPSTHDILEFHNIMWAKICEVLEWENV